MSFLTHRHANQLHAILLINTLYEVQPRVGNKPTQSVTKDGEEEAGDVLLLPLEDD